MAENIFSRAKTIRGKHPRMSVQASVQKAGKELRAEKKAAVGGIKRKAVKKPAVGRVPAKRKTVRVGAVKIGAVKRKPATIGAYERGKVISGTIDKLEKKYAGEKKKELKEILRLAINAEHHKLKDLQRAFKKVK